MIFLVLGVLHFVLRDRRPQERSIYFGAIGVSRTARLVFATCELALGTVLLLTA